MLSIHACGLLFHISTWKLFMHMQVPAQAAGFPAALLKSRIRRIAVCDYITRAFGAVIASAGAGCCRHSSRHGSAHRQAALSTALTSATPGSPASMPKQTRTHRTRRLGPWWVQGAMCGSRAAAGAARRAAR